MARVELLLHLVSSVPFALNTNVFWQLVVPLMPWLAVSLRFL